MNEWGFPYVCLKPTHDYETAKFDCSHNDAGEDSSILGY
jgi:hypothetical protein